MSLISSQVILSSSPGFQITLNQPNVIKCNKKVIITFDPARGGFKRVGFGSEFVLKQGLTNIHVSHKRFSFYQGLSLDDFLSSVKPYIKNCEVFTYGSSGGGYAAIYYAGVIDAKAIALSPRSTIHPSLSNYKTKFSDVEYVHEDLGNNKSKFQPVVVYDPNVAKNHKFCEDVIKLAYPNARFILLKNGLHSVALSLLRNGILKSFFCEIVYNGKVPELEINPLKDERYVSFKVKKLILKGELTEASEMLSNLLTKFPINIKRLMLASQAKQQGVEFDFTKITLPETIKKILLNKFHSNHYDSFKSFKVWERLMLDLVYSNHIDFGQSVLVKNKITSKCYNFPLPLLSKLGNSSRSFKKKTTRHSLKSQGLIYSSFTVERYSVPRELAQRDAKTRIDQFGLSSADWKDKRVLDLGCNNGAMLFHLTNAGIASGLGIEYDTDKIDVAQEICEFVGIDHLRFQQDDIDALDAEKLGTYDIVLALAIEAHVNQSERLFELLGRVTGRVLCFEGNSSCDIDATRNRLLECGFANVVYKGFCVDDILADNNKRPVLIAWK